MGNPSIDSSWTELCRWCLIWYANSQHDLDHVHDLCEHNGRFCFAYHQSHHPRTRCHSRLQPRESDHDARCCDGYDDPDCDQRYGRNMEHRSIVAIRIEFQQRCHQWNTDGQHDAHDVHSVGKHNGWCILPHNQFDHP